MGKKNTKLGEAKDEAAKPESDLKKEIDHSSKETDKQLPNSDDDLNLEAFLSENEDEEEKKKEESRKEKIEKKKVEKEKALKEEKAAKEKIQKEKAEKEKIE